MKIKNLKWPIALFVWIAIGSCHILQKDKQTLKRLAKKEEHQIEAKHASFSEQNQLLVIDSSNNDFTVLLWPKGNFKFSLTNGFEGEAEKVVIKGKQQRHEILGIIEVKRQDSAVLKANYTKQKESSKIVQKKKFKIGFNCVWVALIPVSCILYWLYIRYKRLKNR